jgi:hypothetical protein
MQLGPIFHLELAPLLMGIYAIDDSRSVTRTTMQRVYAVLLTVRTLTLLGWLADLGADGDTGWQLRGKQPV